MGFHLFFVNWFFNFKFFAHKCVWLLYIFFLLLWQIWRSRLVFNSLNLEGGFLHLHEIPIASLICPLNNIELLQPRAMGGLWLLHRINLNWNWQIITFDKLFAFPNFILNDVVIFSYFNVFVRKLLWAFTDLLGVEIVWVLLEILVQSWI